MPIFIEPTELLSSKLKLIPEEFSEKIWDHIEKCNQQINEVFAELSLDGLDPLKTFQHQEIILSTVCEANSLSHNALRSSLRLERLVIARCQVAGLMVELLNSTQGQIGSVLGRNRTTIVNTLKVHNNLLKTDSEYRDKYDILYSHTRKAFEDLKSSASTQEPQ